MKLYRQLAVVGVALGVVGVIGGCSADAGSSSGTTQSTNIVKKPTNKAVTQATDTTNPSNGNLTDNSSASAKAQGSVFALNSKSSHLIKIDMINSQTGYLVGYSEGQFSIWRTNDGGTRWTHTLVPHTPMLNTESVSPIVSFESTNVGRIAWITKNSQSNVLHVLNTTDGGRTWTLHMKNVISVANYVRQIDFSSAKDGWIRAFSGGEMNQGDTTIYHTDNGGKSWTMVSSAGGYVPNKNKTPHALPGLDVPMPMSFTNTRDGWVAAGNVVVTKTVASLYYTHTAGAVWKVTHLPIPTGYHNGFTTTEYQPIFTGSVGTELIQYYHEGTNRLVSYHTTNTGESWAIESNVSLSQNDDRVRQSFLNAHDGWIIGNLGAPFERTTNGGKSWSTIKDTGSLKTLIHNGYRVKQLNMVTLKTGWILLENENSKNGQIRTKLLNTTDGGYKWMIQDNTR